MSGIQTFLRNMLPGKIRYYLLWTPHKLFLISAEIVNRLSREISKQHDIYINDVTVISRVYKKPLGKYIVWVYISIKWIFFRFLKKCYLVLRRIFYRSWSISLRYRYLLVQNPFSLSFKNFVVRQLLYVLLIVPDIRYRKSFRSYAKSLDNNLLQERNRHQKGIVYMIGSLGPGGSERQMVTTLIGLSRRNYSPAMLFCLNLENEIDRFYLPQIQGLNDLRVQGLNHDSSIDHEEKLSQFMAGIQKLPESMHDVSDYLRSIHSYKATVAHLWLDEVNIKAGIAAVTLGIPRIVLEMRSMSPDHFALHQPYMREAYRWLARQRSVVFVNNSYAGARSYEKWLELPEHIINVIYNGFDFDNIRMSQNKDDRLNIRRLYNIPINAPVVGTVMRLSEEKRPLLWLEMAAKLRQKIPDVHFLIVGNGSMMVDVMSRSSNTDLCDNVHLAGHSKDIYSHMAAMDVFLLTSRAEGLPNVLIEAQSIGVPVVTTNAGGASETLSHGITGWVLENDDITDAAMILSRLLGDNHWLQYARDQAPIFVSKKFGMERMIDETIAIYKP